MRFQSILLLFLLAMLTWSRPAHAASSYDNCTGFITSVPTQISTAGTWCLKQDLTTAITGGTAITINADNVILDCNDFRIDGSAGGTNTAAVGVGNFDGNSNMQVRHCNIRGFDEGVELDSNSSGGRTVVENNHLDGNTSVGVWVSGESTVIRHNVILNTGSLSYAVAGGPIGIFVGDLSGTVDVIDNTINGAGSQCGSTQCGAGIRFSTSSASGINVVGNRIGGLPPNVSNAGAITFLNRVRADVRENEIIGSGSTGSGTGVNCQSSTGATLVRVHDNIIDGFATPISACADGGENDTSP